MLHNLLSCKGIFEFQPKSSFEKLTNSAVKGTHLPPIEEAPFLLLCCWILPNSSSAIWKLMTASCVDKCRGQAGKGLKEGHLSAIEEALLGAGIPAGYNWSHISSPLFLFGNCFDLSQCTEAKKVEKKCGQGVQTESWSISFWNIDQGKFIGFQRTSLRKEIHMQENFMQHGTYFISSHVPTLVRSWFTNYPRLAHAHCTMYIHCAFSKV